MPDVLNSVIELHDSVLGSLAQVGDSVQVILRPAYVHQSVGKPGVDAGSGFVQNFTLEFGEAQIEGEIGALPSDIFHGEFQAGTQTFPNEIGLPCDWDAAASLVLFLSPDNRRIAITGRSVRATADSEAVFVEDFRP